MRDWDFIHRDCQLLISAGAQKMDTSLSFPLRENEMDFPIGKKMHCQVLWHVRFC